MRRASLLCFLVGFLIFSADFSATQAAPDRPSIAINFAADEPLIGGGVDYDSFVEGAAGVLRTENWNNIEVGGLFQGGPDGLKMDDSGTFVDSTATVEWICQNTWSSDGRGTEDTNDAEEGNDRNLMLGYLDTNATDPGFVIVDNLDPVFVDNGFDVYVYMQGGVLDRGGAYTIGDQTVEHTVLERFDGTWIEGDEGNYLVFANLTGTGFELEFQPEARGNGTFRAVVNAVEIVARTGGGGLRGDFNGDDTLDAMDIDELTRQSAGGGNNSAYDLTGDGLVNSADVTEWISAGDIYNSWQGDANLDGEFNTNDLVVVLASGTYEQDVDSVWSTGDFDGSGRTNTNDLVAALSGGGYEAGPKAAAQAAVPEPSGALLGLGIGAALLILRRRR